MPDFTPALKPATGILEAVKAAATVAVAAVKAAEAAKAAQEAGAGALPEPPKAVEDTPNAEFSDALYRPDEVAVGVDPVGDSQFGSGRGSTGGRGGRKSSMTLRA